MAAPAKSAPALPRRSSAGKHEADSSGTKTLKKDFTRYEMFMTLLISNISLYKGWTVLISEIGEVSKGSNLERDGIKTLYYSDNRGLFEIDAT